MTDPPDGMKNAKIDINGRMKMPAELSRYLKQFEYPTTAKPTTKRRRQAANSSSPKTAR